MLLDHRSNNRLNLKRMYNTVHFTVFISAYWILSLTIKGLGDPQTAVNGREQIWADRESLQKPKEKWIFQRVSQVKDMEKYAPSVIIGMFVSTTPSTRPQNKNYYTIYQTLNHTMYHTVYHVTHHVPHHVPHHWILNYRTTNLEDGGFLSGVQFAVRVGILALTMLTFGLVWWYQELERRLLVVRHHLSSNVSLMCSPLMTPFSLELIGNVVHTLYRGAN